MGKGFMPEDVPSERAGWSLNFDKPSPEVLDWVENDLAPALLAGAYAQIRNKLEGTLPNGDPAYCCLGVACHLALVHPPKFVSSAGVMERQVRDWDKGVFYHFARSEYPTSEEERGSSATLPFHFSDILGRTFFSTGPEIWFTFTKEEVEAYERADREVAKAFRNRGTWQPDGGLLCKVTASFANDRSFGNSFPRIAEGFLTWVQEERLRAGYHPNNARVASRRGEQPGQGESAATGNHPPSHSETGGTHAKPDGNDHPVAE